MKVSDYIVDYFIDKQITDVFGYPGGMVTHLMDSFSMKRERIRAHVNYHEQGASFAACGYAQVSLRPGVAYATSGPGATNLITGICNAYFDSIPVVFITGQVNTYESKRQLQVRQKGFQETDIVEMVKNVTKYSVLVSDANEVRYHLEKAYALSLEGRPGPVLLDIPMNIQRSDIMPESMKGYESISPPFDSRGIDIMMHELEKSDKPCILVGAGVSQSGMRYALRELADNLQIPIMTSMIAIDAMPTEHACNFGFIGAYGSRYSNFILSKCDLLIAFGTRLDVRQTGSDMDAFAMNARLVRIEVDENELSNRIKPAEVEIIGNLKTILPLFVHAVKHHGIDLAQKYKSWVNQCMEIKALLVDKDNLKPNDMMKQISALIPNNSIITTDVGQNQVWVSQSFSVKDNQRVLFSGGHGAMGYSLPASIGAFYAGKGDRVYCFTGDGGIQMNIQELQFIAREKLPITIILINNKALGMIRHFQEIYFKANYTQTVENEGYEAPDFSLIANAYGFEYFAASGLNDIREEMFSSSKPRLIEVILSEKTYVFPKSIMNKPYQDQDPPMDRDLYRYIMEL